LNSIIRRIKNFFYYGWALKDSYDFDNYYLDEIILLKLQRMRACFSSEEFHHNRWSLKEELSSTNQIEFKQGLVEQYKADVALDICIALLKRRMEASYYDTLVGLEKLYEGTEHKFEDSTITLLVNGEPASVEFKKKLNDARHLSAEIEARDQKLFYYLLQKYTNHWWS
jgi:hypothetical protein